MTLMTVLHVGHTGGFKQDIHSNSNRYNRPFSSCLNMNRLCHYFEILEIFKRWILPVSILIGKNESAVTFNWFYQFWCDLVCFIFHNHSAV